MVILQVNPSGFTTEEIETEKKHYLAWYESMKDLVHSLMWQEHSGVSNAAPMDCKCHLLAGSEYVHEVLMGTKYVLCFSPCLPTDFESPPMLSFKLIARQQKCCMDSLKTGA